MPDEAKQPMELTGSSQWLPYAPVRGCRAVWKGMGQSLFGLLLLTAGLSLVAVLILPLSGSVPS